MGQSCSTAHNQFISNRFRMLFANKFENAEKNIEIESAEDDIEQAVEAYVEEKCVSELSNTKNRSYTIEDFDLIRVIGRGGFAKVYVAELKSGKEVYALKVIKKTMLTTRRHLQLLQTEKRVYESVESHPFLVGLRSCFQTATRLFFVMEFVRGGDLATLVSNRRQLPENQARFYAAEIALALNFLHNIGIIYRDLKLDNVLLDHEGHIKLTDYGICKEGMSEGKRTTSFCGTLRYIAPEMIQGNEYSFSVDWWAFGIILFEMLDGRSPFKYGNAIRIPESQFKKLLFEEILNHTIVIPKTLSLRANIILKRLLCKEPANRLGSVVENTQKAFKDVKEHIFFQSIDWEQLKQRQMKPPYLPELNLDIDLSYFPAEFTDEPIEFTPDRTEHVMKIQQEHFEGF